MSTSKVDENRKILARVHEALDEVGVKKYGRVKEVAEKTGYSYPQVSALLSDKAKLNDRFLSALSSKFMVSEEWIKYGSGDKKQKEVSQEEPAAEHGSTENSALARVREKLSPEKQIWWDDVMKMTDDEALELVLAWRKQRSQGREKR